MSTLNSTTQISGGFVERDCLHNLPVDHQFNCTTDTCQTCTGAGCNNAIFPNLRLTCHTCAGGPESNCSGVITGNPVICPIFSEDDQCYIARPNGNFERGCLSTNRNRCGDDESCHLCSGNGCNSVDYNSAFSITSSAKFIAFVAIFILTIFK